MKDMFSELVDAFLVELESEKVPPKIVENLRELTQADKPYTDKNLNVAIFGKDDSK